jgi:hypothetical protein
MFILVKKSDSEVIFLSFLLNNSDFYIRRIEWGEEKELLTFLIQ